MSEIWMFTCQREEEYTTFWNEEIKRKITKKEIRLMLQANDCHKWVVGFEEGADGYRHYQGRLVSSNDAYFDWAKAHIGVMHVEKAEKWTDYESKSGRFVSSDDFLEMQKTRFSTPTQAQRQALNWMKEQSVREIDFWYDPKGYSGKSFLVNWAWETHQAHYIRPMNSTDKIIADVCSKMKHERRPYLLIDVPRIDKVGGDLLGALETIKDGLVDDPRYEGETINIRGVKVLVMTNQKITGLSHLSSDRVFVNGKKYAGGKVNGQG